MKFSVPLLLVCLLLTFKTSCHSPNWQLIKFMAFWGKYLLLERHRWRSLCETWVNVKTSVASTKVKICSRISFGSESNKISRFGIIQIIKFTGDFSVIRFIPSSGLETNLIKLDWIKFVLLYRYDLDHSIIKYTFLFINF